MAAKSTGRLCRICGEAIRAGTAAFCFPGSSKVPRAFYGCVNCTPNAEGLLASHVAARGAARRPLTPEALLALQKQVKGNPRFPAKVGYWSGAWREDVCLSCGAVVRRGFPAYYVQATETSEAGIYGCALCRKKGTRIRPKGEERPSAP
jgi:predicted RNA-binding Zn-ribbon protein involved in translation (DUF1610 family)